jgi:hypothetical protein
MQPYRSGMPPKRARRTEAAAMAAGEEEPARHAPGAFQPPPYKQARPIMWYKKAESLMDMQKITNPAFRLVLVQCALPDALQESVALILEADTLASEAYSQLKAKLTCMHVKTSWDRLAKLFALPPCGAQKGTELLAAMERLKPEDPELWFRWQYFSRLLEWIQRQLAEDTSPVRELAKRVDELQRKAPPPATVAAVPAPPWSRDDRPRTPGPTRSPGTASAPPLPPPPSHNWLTYCTPISRLKPDTGVPEQPRPPWQHCCGGVARPGSSQQQPGHLHRVCQPLQELALTARAGLPTD